MYIEGETETTPIKLAAPLQIALAFAALLVIYIGVYPQPIINFTQKAALSQGLKTYSYQQEGKSEQPADRTGAEPERVEPPPPPR
jgi:NADH:ubiquinone oxidoreductase subunit 4 (subunit M)